MLSEVNMRMVFSDQKVAMAVWELCDPLYPDTYLPEDEPPTLDVDGTYTVTATMRIEDTKKRDLLVTSLLEYKKNTIDKSYGFIKFHDCGHDSGLPCENEISDIWNEPPD